MGLSIIIAEFNPLTNGHKYLIEETKKLFPENKIVVIMSGNFVQRGEPAIIDKFSRAESAISLGVDTVIELPVVFSLSSAEDFAYGAIKIASSFDGENTLVFGSECGDINLLKDAIKRLQSTENDPKIKENLKNGMSFASSQIKAVGGILEKPNNLLGVMYLKAINDQTSNLKVATIKREGDYNSTEINSNFASARAIREKILEGELISLKDKIPHSMNEKLQSYTPLSTEKLFSMVQYKLQTTSVNELETIEGVTEGIQYRFIDKTKQSKNYNQFIELVSTKRYPKNKVRRIILNILLNITKDKKQEFKNNFNYFRVLSVNNKESYSLLSKSQMKSLTKKKDENLLNEQQIQFLNTDKLADEIYKILKS